MNCSITITIFLSFLLSACTQTPPKLVGEQLITPFKPLVKEWQVDNKQQENWQQISWQQTNKSWENSLTITIARHQQHQLQEQKGIIDQPGQLSCDKFISRPVPYQAPTEDNIQTAYQALMWQTLCKKENGFKASILHLLIQGNDAFYHIQKTWQNKLSKQQNALWRKKFQQVYICDTRLQNTVCPKLTEN